MTHPLILQLQFTRNEFKRALTDLTDDEARRRFLPMNCISWNIGHLAWQEQRYLLWKGQGQLLLPEVDEQFTWGAAASTPALDYVWSAWYTITQAIDPWLETLTTEDLQQHIFMADEPKDYIPGSLIQRVIYHYWYHAGENMAIRQLIGTAELPELVGDIDSEAPYRPEQNS